MHSKENTNMRDFAAGYQEGKLMESGIPSLIINKRMVSLLTIFGLDFTLYVKVTEIS